MQIPEGAPVLEGYTPFVVSWWKEYFVFHMISEDGHRMAVCWWNGHDVEFTEKRIVANLLQPLKKWCGTTAQFVLWCSCCHPTPGSVKNDVNEKATNGYCPRHGWYGCNEKTHREG